MHKFLAALSVGALLTCFTACVSARPVGKGGPPVSPVLQHQAMSLSDALAPYAGPVERSVDTSTLYGKVMCGYQGWFLAKGDGYKPGIVHWGPVDRTPPRCTVDLWPDMTELAPDECFPTNYRYADGTAAEVFSSAVKKTVGRHFKWMRDYGIDGVFVQRFTSCVSNQSNWNYQRTAAVLHHCREGANRTGRAFAVMYDTNFDRRAVDAMKADWARLVNEMKLMTTPAYIRHRGGPVVGLWGYGFGHRKFDVAAAEELFRFFKEPENGGCTIMLGVPNDWASWTDDRMRLLKQYATIISPWNVGRYGDPKGAKRHADRYWPGDLALCKQNHLDYYAVAFPGFSWANLQKGKSPLNQIPRLGGRFFWSQIEEIRRHGMDMVYVAMFDEVDEGTAIFKCTNQPPIGRFATYEGLPSDHYLRLTGLAGRFLRGGDVAFPEVKPDPAQMTYRPLTQLEYYQDPGRLPAEMVERWQRQFAGIRLTVHPEPYSDWVRDLYDSRAFDLALASWQDIVTAATPSPLIVFASGNEGLNAAETETEQIVETYRAHVQRGGTLLVLSAGRYPMFYPNGGREAAKFGFRLKMVASPANSRVEFRPEFATTLQPWTMAKAGGSRLMRRELYPNASSYTALATVRLSDGTAHGDAIACVQPGGDLGEGRIIYVAGDLQRYPDREQLLDAILTYTHAHASPAADAERRNRP